MAPVPVSAWLPVEEGGIVTGDAVGATVLEVGEGGISRSVIIIPVKVDILLNSAICVENRIIITGSNQSIKGENIRKEFSS